MPISSVVTAPATTTILESTWMNSNSHCCLLESRWMDRWLVAGGSTQGALAELGCLVLHREVLKIWDGCKDTY
jgi:hypothetical protein